MALAVPPSDFWSGIDGSWSTFVLQVGTPPVAVDVLISTSEPVEYVIVPDGCSSSRNSSCASARGNLYDPTQSNTWQMKGWYTTTVESNLGYNNKGEYGFDTVALGYQGSGGPSLGNQIVTGIATDDFYLGLFGLLPKPFNFTNYDDPYPSYLQTLKDNNEIPSISWAYTAGAKYRVNGVYGSLTLGGYDVSRFESNSLTIPMNSDITKYLSIGVQSITVAGTPSGGGKVLSDGIIMMLDSTLPYMWLPEDACQKIADAFNLDYHEDTKLYTISNTVRSGLLAQKTPPSVTFTLGVSASGGETVQISLPYQAFDLNAQPPLVDNSTNYFPVKRAANESQYVLGRAFFQEAYVIADFERSNFSVSQVRFESGARAALTAIAPPGQPTVVAKQKSSSHAGAIAGAVVGVLVVLAVIAVIAFFLLRRRRRQKRQPKPVSPSEDSERHSSEDRAPPYSPPAPNTIELPSNNKRRPELEATESGQGTPTHGYYSRSPEMSKQRDMQERSRSPLSELEARTVHELPGSNAEDAENGALAETAKPLHLRTVSRDEIRMPSAVPTTNNAAPPTSRPVLHDRQISDYDLPGAFVQSPGRSFGSRREAPLAVTTDEEERTRPTNNHSREVSPPASAALPRHTFASGDISPPGSATMSPDLRSRRTVSSDSVPIILDKPDKPD